MILGSKYPNAQIPNLQKDWLEKRNTSGLELTFQNIIEWNLGLELSGKDKARGLYI